MSSADKAAAAAGPGGAAGGGGAAGVVPAQLGFLAIYNPSLGTTDETIEDQIAYYGGATVGATVTTNDNTSNPTNTRRRRRSSASAAAPTAHLAPAERNERLRQIGLAQGMVAFGRSFAGDQAVDTIETDKTRVVLHELEPGWWILASVDLTKLPTPEGGEEFSAREVKPAALLLQDLLRAHSVFLLHHDISLDALFRRVTPRSRFTVLLARYWDIFLSSWSVLLHGNPVRDVFPGMRLAACGELGIGVGEEERGSGEREVLEGLVESTDGLVDLVVCRYGEAPKGVGFEDDEFGLEALGGDDTSKTGDDTDEDSVWLGTSSGLGSEDGAIFLGVGALTRPALRSLTYWMEDVYIWGQDAYSIADNPSAPSRQARHRKKGLPTMGSISEQHQEQKKKKGSSQQPQEQPQQPVMLPPPSLFPPKPVTQITARATKSPTPTQAQPIPAPSSSSSASQTSKDSPSKGTPASTLSESASSGGMDKYMSIMKLGYGTYWSLGGSSVDAASDTLPTSGASKEDNGSKQTRFHNTSRAGRFLIPLVEDTNEDKTKNTTSIDDSVSSEDSVKPKEPTKTAPKAPPRTIIVEMAKSSNDASRPTSANETLQESQDEGESKTQSAKGKGKEAETPPAPEALTSHTGNKLRVVVYAQRPFLYTFLFDQGSVDSPTVPDAAAPPRMSEEIVQKLIDRQLSVLHKPLLKSTAYRPNKPGVVGAAAMLNAAVASSSSNSSASASGAIYDLIWDPGMLTIHSTIPNIPDPYAMLKMMAADNAAGKGKRSKKAVKQQQQLGLQGPQTPWSRVEALNTHMQILNMYAATRSNGAELERMCKTSRGWWIVWNRLVERTATESKSTPGQSKYGSTLFEEEETKEGDDNDSYQRAPSDCESDDTATVQAASAAALGTYTVRKEIILIRKASDHVDNASGGGRNTTSESLGGGSGLGFGLGMGGRATSAMRAFSASTYLGFGGSGASGGSSSAGTASKVDAAAAEEAAAAADRGAGWADGASKLAQGIGVDTKKYIEGLLTLNK
ncbi:hypothetical protein Sste5346_003237 [Sporothrix stenoceras]|uniref:CCZ1/INTU/HSP4 first Longin domain-containing protein n=1 Tax=Sporothrix stenoceras TaxID=5173 RepID=A0ABR3ZF55_9PEZI